MTCFEVRYKLYGNEQLYNSWAICDLNNQRVVEFRIRIIKQIYYKIQFEYLQKNEILFQISSESYSKLQISQREYYSWNYKDQDQWDDRCREKQLGKRLKSPINLNSSLIKGFNEDGVLEPADKQEDEEQQSSSFWGGILKGLVGKKTKEVKSVIVDIDFDKLVVKDQNTIYYNKNGERINSNVEDKNQDYNK